MSIYPPSIAAICAELRFVGVCADASAIGRAASFECGVAVKVTLRIDLATKRIEEIRYETNGCGYVIAAGESIGGLFEGRKLNDLHGTDEIEWQLISAFPDLSHNRRHCVRISVDAFRNALAEYRSRCVEEFRGEKALICTCFSVDEDTIAAVVAREDVSAIDDVAAICNAGSGCGSCRMLIQEFIDGNESRNP